MCVKEKFVLLLQIHLLWPKKVIPKTSTANDHAQFIPFWCPISTIPTIFFHANQPMRIQLDEWDNVGRTSEVRKYCVISLSSKAVSICIDIILTEWNPLWNIAQVGHKYDAEEWKMFHTWGLFDIKARTELFYRPHPSAVIFVLVGAETKLHFSELPIEKLIKADH